VIRRRRLLATAAALGVAEGARGQSGVSPEWLGSYAGALSFYRSIPLEDI
jgi:hypothetical protein